MDESVSLLEGVADDVNEKRIVWTLCKALALNSQILMNGKGDSPDKERLIGVVMRLMEIFKELDVGIPIDHRRKIVVHSIKRALGRSHKHD